MLSEDERFEEDMEQAKYLQDYMEKKEMRRRERKIKRDNFVDTFRSSIKH